MGHGEHIVCRESQTVGNSWLDITAAILLVWMLAPGETSTWCSDCGMFTSEMNRRLVEMTCDGGMSWLFSLSRRVMRHVITSPYNSILRQDAEYNCWCELATGCLLSDEWKMTCIRGVDTVEAAWPKSNFVSILPDDHLGWKWKNPSLLLPIYLSSHRYF